jgi:hypothetical protein
MDAASLAASAVGLQQSQTQQALQMAFAKQQAQADQQLVQMLTETIAAALLPGVGGSLDVKA